MCRADHGDVAAKGVKVIRAFSVAERQVRVGDFLCLFRRFDDALFEVRFLALLMFIGPVLLSVLRARVGRFALVAAL